MENRIKERENKIKNRIKEMRASTILLYVTFLALMILTISNKADYHLDEMYSYGLSNHQDSMYISIEDGKRYMPPSEPYIEYLTVRDTSRFDYKNVWRNQAEDVHPPLYYALLHTICSIFPGTFSKWYAGSINIVFALWTLFVLRKLIRNLTGNDDKVCSIVSVLFVLSSGILSAVSLFRMYIFVMFWVTLLTEMLVKEVGIRRSDRKFFLKLYAVAVLGALTHYYCIVFTIFICTVFGVFLLLKKKWDSMTGLIVIGILAGSTAYFIFPSMIIHMFYGYRGTEAIDNLKQSPYEFWTRMKDFFNIVNNEAFGNSLGYIVVGLVLFAAVYCVFENHNNFRSIKKWLLGILSPDVNAAKILAMKYTLIFVPVVMYFLIVTKMAAYIIDRYMFPIYAVSIGGLVSLAVTFLRNVLKDKIVYFIVAIMMSIIIVNEWKNVEWTYLYRPSVAFFEQLEEYADVDCLYIYDSTWKTQPSFLEIQKYRSVTFVHYDNLGILASLEISNQNQLMVLVNAEDKTTLGQIMEVYPQLNASKEMRSFGFSTTYYLYAQ